MNKAGYHPSVLVTSDAIHTTSSRMCVVNRKWSATKQRLHPQSVAEISRHSVLSGDRIRFDNVRHHRGLATRTQISVCKSPFPSAGTAMSLFRVKNGSAETTVAEGGRNLVAGLWGRTLGEN